MFRSLLGPKLVSRTRAVRYVALIVSLFAVAALPYVSAGAWQQQKQVGGKKSGAVNDRINTRQGEKPTAKVVAVKKETRDAQKLAVCAQNQPINFGQTINGSLADGDCVSPVTKPGQTQPDGSLADEYTFNGTAGQQIAISMSSTAFDTYLYLLRPDGTVLAQNDDANQDSDPNSRIPPNGFIILPFSGTYSILASSFAPEARGAYTLTLTAGANCSLTPIAYGETKQGSLTAGDCTNSIDQDGTLVDLYTFDGTAGQQVSITMTATAPGNVDPYLYLVQPDGNLIAEDANGGGGTVAHIPTNGDFGRLPMTGTYTIVANTTLSSQSGNYSLTLTKAATDCANVPLTLATPANGTLANGDCRLLEDGSFLDAYTFTAAANAQITITMTSSTAGLTPVVFLLSPTGSVLAIEVAPTGGNTARIPGTGSFSLPVTGTYTVLANSFAPNQTGNYTLTLTRNVQPKAHTISGQVTGGGVGLSGVTVTLSGGASATTTTDANGFYAFVEFPAGNSYTITPTNTAQYSFTPQTVPSLQTDQTVNFVGIPRASEIIISEFRTFGPTGSCDEFVEIYNTRSTQYVVQVADNSSGFAVAQSNGNVLFIIPNNTVIPARGHYLAVNNGGGGCTGAYSNSDYPAGNGTTATGDNTLNEDIISNAGIAIFNTSNQGSFNLTNRLDAVGTSAEANPLYKEGTGYPVFQPNVNETNGPRYSIFRNAQSGLPQDTNNNETDFQTADESSTAMCTSTANFNCRRLGAPGPENLSSPVQHNADIKASLVDPQCSGITVNPTLRSACRFERRSEQVGLAPSFGTFAIRRRFTNMTGSSVTRLRFRIVDITNDGFAPSNIADIRAITSPQVTATCQNESGTPHLCSDTGLPTTTIEGTTREPDQPFSNGGGFNSTVSAGTVTLANPLASGASVNLQFLFGVQRAGAFRFFVNVEALTSPPNALDGTKAGATKRAGSRKGQ
jgi:hypothetical protein